MMTGLGSPDDSDEDPDYPAGPSTVHEESSDVNDDELPDVDNEQLPFPLPPAQGASQQHKKVASDPAAGERPAKKARAEWTWTPADLPNRTSPEQYFFPYILTKLDRLYWNGIILTSSWRNCMRMC